MRLRLNSGRVHYHLSQLLPGNELVRVENHIHVSSKAYVDKIMCKYQKAHGHLKKEVLPMRVKEHPELDKYPFLNEKEHK